MNIPLLAFTNAHANRKKTHEAFFMVSYGLINGVHIALGVPPVTKNPYGLPKRLAYPDDLF